MKYRSIFARAARLRENGNSYILAKLKKAGLEMLAPSHGDILVCLLNKESCTMSEIAIAVHRSKSTVTVLVEKLERYGFAERFRDSSDSRKTLVHLTEKGKNLQPLFAAVSEGLQQMIESRLTTEEADMLDQLLAKCLDK